MPCERRAVPRLTLGWEEDTVGPLTVRVTAGLEATLKLLDGFCQISDHEGLQAHDVVVAQPAAKLDESCFPALDGAGFRAVV